MAIAIAALGEDRQRIVGLVSHALSALFAPRHLTRPPAAPSREQTDHLEAARVRYHATRAAYMRTPSAPGTPEERAFQAAFQALDMARFGPRRPLPRPSPELQAAALRAARL